MKQFIFILLVTLLASGCGVGIYSTTSGKADEAAISFTAPSKEAVVVDIDGSNFSVNTVKKKAYKASNKLKATTQNTIRISTGQHKIIVRQKGTVLFSKTIFVSAGEHKIIEL